MRADEADEAARCRSRRRAPTASKIDWAPITPPKPTFLGTRAFDDLRSGRAGARYIDWTPFFQTWELRAAIPRILEDDMSARQRASCSTTRRPC